MAKTIDSSNWLRNFTLALGLLILSGLSYGLLAPKMGFFLDDWYIVSTYRIFGVFGFTEYFKGDRPLLSYIYLIFMPIFKDSILAWQIFAIFTKWLSALMFWILLEMLLPGKRLFAYATALLFSIYPGFKFHYFVIMYSQTYFLLAVYFSSYILMLLAFRQSKYSWVFMLLALVCQFLGIAPMEYFYGLELIRPILIYLILPHQGQHFRSRALTALRLWLPYGLIFLSFTAFRILSSHQFSYGFNLLSNLQSHPIDTLINLVFTLIRGIFDSCFLVWTSFTDLFNSSEGLRALALRIGLVGVAFLIAYLLFSLMRQKKAPQETRTPAWLIWLGLACVMVAMVPFIVAGFKANLDFPNNRFLLALSIGASLFTVALIDQLFRTQTQKMVILALLIGLSVGTNYLTAREFKQSWEKQKDFFAQMTWRMPQIKPGTNLVTTILPFAQYFSGTSLTAPLNLIYAPDNHDNPIPYQIVLAATAEQSQLPDLTADQVITSRLRGFIFEGNTSDMLVLYVPENGCLQVLSKDADPTQFVNDRYYSLWKEIIPLSNLSRIRTNAIQSTLPDQYFRTIEEETWCYFYEKAELANQNLDWATTVNLYSRSQSLNLSPQRNEEYYPFISAFQKTGNIESALELSEVIQNPGSETKSVLCPYWIEQIPTISSSILNERAVKLIDSWQCEVPCHE